jgi:hypothetical protein
MGAAGMSSVDLASATDYSPEFIDALVAGEGEPLMGIEVVLTLCVQLGCAPGYLIEEVVWVRGEEPGFGAYALADPENFPAVIDWEAVGASIRRPMGKEYEIATVIRIAGSLTNESMTTTPSDLMKGSQRLVKRRVIR